MTTLDDLYRRILAEGPSSETLHIVLSGLKEAGMSTLVIQECIKALHTHPDDISLRQLLAETYVDAGLLAHAEAELDRVMPKLDDLAPLYKLHADVLYRQRRGEEAAKSLQIYLAHRPEDREALELLQAMEASRRQKPLEAPSPGPEAVEPAEAFGVEEEEPFVEAVEEERFEEEDLLEIVTPTLAEVYVNQGQIVEAIKIYERIATQDPADAAVRGRIEELKAMAEPQRPKERPEEDLEAKKKEKMVSTLESWLEEMRKVGKDPTPA
jgi:tetratricopeptide (TPR) repeat protein